MMKNMIRKVKIKNMENGEAFLDYGKVSNPSAFRHCILKGIIQSAASDVALMIDTNLRIADKPMVLDEAALQQMQLRYAVLPTQSNQQMFFGFRLNALPGAKAARAEQRIILELTGSALPAELFKTIENYDIALGFGRKMSFDEICRNYQVSGDGMLFNTSFFENSLYDSVICARLRSTFHLEQYLEAVSNEMAL